VGVERYFVDTERRLFGEESRPSIPIKDSRFDYRPLDPLRSGVLEYTSRTATALFMAAESQGLALRPGITILRCFRWSGQIWGIENGCGQDIVRNGSAGLIPAEDPREDRFVLTAAFIEWFEGPAGRR
jgi:hypothetical protein